MKRHLLFSLLLILFFLSRSALLAYAEGENAEKKLTGTGTTKKKSKDKSNASKTRIKSQVPTAAKSKKISQAATKRRPGTPSLPVIVIEKQSENIAQVTDMRSWSNPDYTRIAVSIDKDVEYGVHRLGKVDDPTTPPRLYIDMKGARIAPGVKDIPIGDGLLKMARIAQFRPDIVRVVLDIENIKDYNIFPLSDPPRIILDVRGERKVELSRLEPELQAAQPLTEAEKIQPREDHDKIPPRLKFSGVRRIVVDPGHGGHDPGAVGAGGTREKDVVLEVGQRLARKLRDELGVDVVMTRSTDVFIPLEERTAIANKVNADLFVSVHANAAPNRQANGIETYYLNLAKSDKAAQLAARENNTSLEKVSMLQGILIDLMVNYKINDSAHLAEEVQKSLIRQVEGHFSGVRNLGVKQGPFYVLLGATMPSILVETAFISNEKEELRLKDSRYLDATAEGILKGIKGYAAGLRQEKQGNREH